MRRRLPVGIVVVAIALVASGGLVWLDRYRPLHGAARSFSADWRQAEDGWVVTEGFVYGERVPIVLELTNDGPLPVTVLGIEELPESFHALLRLEEILVPKDGEVGALVDLDEWERAGPFVLQRGQGRTVVLMGRFDDCRFHMPGGSQGYGSIEIRFRSLWAERTMLVPLGTDYRVVSPQPERCPTPEDFGAVPLRQPVEGRLVRWDNYVACVMTAGSEEVCGAIPGGQWSTTITEDWDEAVARGAWARIDPDADGSIRSISELAA